MNQTFETTRMPVIIDIITYTGSAFAVNDKGEQVFVNQRIVERCNLTEGQEAVAHVFPNYEDKRASIPWRAMRVDIPREIGIATLQRQAPAPVVKEPSLEERVLDLLSNGEYWSTSELRLELGIAAADGATVNNACQHLFTQDKVVKANVYASSSQTKASFSLWALSVEAFR